MSVFYLWPECKGKTVVVLMLNQETLQYVFVPKVKVAQSCLTFCDPMDCMLLSHFSRVRLCSTP